MIHERPKILGRIIHGERAGLGAVPAETADVRRNEVPTLGNALELRPPHVGSDREGVNQQHRPPRARFEIPHVTSANPRARLTNHQPIILCVVIGVAG